MFKNTHELLNSRDRIFVDTCSLLSGGFVRFLEQNRCFFLSENKRIAIPLGVIRELERFESEDSERGIKAKYALKMINSDPDGLFTIFESDLRPDDFFVSYSAAHRSDEHILVITQDYMACRSIIKLNEERTGFYNKTVFVKRISYDGALLNFDLTKTPTQYTTRSNRTNASVLLATLMK